MAEDMDQHKHRERLASRKHAALAAMVTLLWFASWSIWLTPRTLTANAKVSVVQPSVVYMPPASPHNERNEDEALRALWSPVLFALPSSDGFSRSLLENKIGIRPPLDTPSSSAIYLERMSAQAYAIPARHMNRVLQNLVDKRLETLPISADGQDPFARTEAPVHPRLKLKPLSGGLTQDDFKDWPPVSTPIALGPGAWEAEVNIDVSARGGVDHVYLLTPTESPARNSEILRAMYSWRFTDTGTGRHGRVRLLYPGEHVSRNPLPASWLQ